VSNSDKMKTKIFLIEKKKKLTALWTKEEDEQIRQYLSLNPKNKWKFIAAKLKNKTATQVFLRSKIIDPNLKKGKFSNEEDRILKKLVEIFGPSWSLISKLYKKRNPKQLRLRYSNHLNERISKEKFSLAEDQKLLSLFELHGRKWSFYSNHLPQRSLSKIRYRCFSLFKKRHNSKEEDKKYKYRISNNINEKEDKNITDSQNNINYL